MVHTCFFMKHLKHLLPSCALLILASVSQAATMRVQFDSGLFDASGYDGGVKVSYATNKSRTVDVGLFSGVVTTYSGIESSVFPYGTSSFVAYCYDLPQDVDRKNSVTYTVDMEGGTARTLDFLGAVNHALASYFGYYDPFAWLNPTNSGMAAAIQIGIWESLYDTSGWSISSGTFHVDDGASTSTKSWLNAFFSALGSSDALDGKYVMTLKSGTAQDLLTGSVPPPPPVSVPPSEVPEPATLALVGMALVGLAAWRRRKG